MAGGVGKPGGADLGNSQVAGSRYEDSRILIPPLGSLWAMRRVLLVGLAGLLAVSALAQGHGFAMTQPVGPFTVGVSESGTTGDDAPGCALGKSGPVPNPDLRGCGVDDGGGGHVSGCVGQTNFCLDRGGAIRICHPTCSSILVVLID